jgi:hypothetical protein
MTLDRLRSLSGFQAGLEQAAGQRVEVPVSPYPKLVGCVFGNPTVPTSTGVYYSMHPVDVGGSEGEGNPGVLSVDTSRSFLAYVIGPKAPVAGDSLACWFLGNRWVAERLSRQATGVFLPGCPCTSVPRTLQVSVSKPNSNGHIFHPATLQYYSPVPSQFSSLALGSFAFLSTTSFTDDFSANPFWYLFGCFQGYYALSRVYPGSSTGPAFRDSVRYKWLIGFTGNTCSPFLLSNGVIFSGGDASCVVTMSE